MKMLIIGLKTTFDFDNLEGAYATIFQPLLKSLKVNLMEIIKQLKTLKSIKEQPIRVFLEETQE